LLDLIEADRAAIHGLKCASGSALRLHDVAIRSVVFRIRDAVEQIGVSDVTVAASANHLERLGIVREVTGRSRNKLFVYSNYLAILGEGTAPES
jgi:Fic family protein